MPHGGPHTLAGEFVNRRTGEPVPAGVPYHLHEGQAMEGEVHSEIQGGTQGHDFFDRINGRNDMPHEPGHTNGNNAPYKIYGTDEPYNGMTVELGGKLYSTVGGTLEGDSMLLVANTTPPRMDRQILTSENQMAPDTQTGGGGGTY